MTREEIDIILSEHARRAIEDRIGCDPVLVALDKRIPHAGLIATQVKYLQRARAKLPSYHAARCVIPPLAFEQSSSEQTAALREYSGALCIDLTCGLGVDALAFSRRFGEVIAVERDPALAYLARRNFELLGASNIRVVNMAAEEFLAANPSLSPDLIYADPDRRGPAGRKLLRLEECAPDIVGLLPRLRAMSGRIVVKMSPLFDVDEAFRIFGKRTRVEVVSLGGECKEVIAETGERVAKGSVAASAAGFGKVEYDAENPVHVTAHPMPGTPGYLAIPDVALAKARIAKRLFTEAGFSIESDNSYAFGDTAPHAALPAKTYRITSIRPYIPAKLKKELRQAGIGRVEILKRDFPHSASDIARHLGVAEGGDTRIAFTRLSGSPVAIYVIPL